MIKAILPTGAELKAFHQTHSDSDGLHESAVVNKA